MRATGSTGIRGGGLGGGICFLPRGGSLIARRRLFLFQRFRTGGDGDSFISHFRDGSKVQLVYMIGCISPTVIEISIVEFGVQCFEEVGWHGFDPYYEFDVSERVIRNFV